MKLVRKHSLTIGLSLALVAWASADVLELRNGQVLNAKHLKKLTKALPMSKVLRFAPLAMHLQIASAIPLVPTDKSKGEGKP